MSEPSSPIQCLPNWHYQGHSPTAQEADPLNLPWIHTVDHGTYVRKDVSNLCDAKGRQYFDTGLRLLLSYQHEMAARCFLTCLQSCPDCALAHGLVALCHSPNYNFKGEPYYESAHHPEEEQMHDLLCIFPSQQVADRHSKQAVEKIESLRKLHRAKKGKNNKNKKSTQSKPTETTSCGGPTVISDVETQLLLAIRKLTCHPGLNHELSHDIVGRPFADAMRKVHQRYPHDPEVTYCFAEALMVLNAWKLYEFPTGKPVSSTDVQEIRTVLETALPLHPHHAGLCHMYVHLSEMSAHPELALTACQPLREQFPNAGHLIHMPTHIDVLVGDYANCVKYNIKAIEADERAMVNSPGTAGTQSFYFGYIVHNYHMAVYGAILGGFEQKAMELAKRLNALLSEAVFEQYPDLTAYLEAYSALDVHVLIRFGRWQEILQLEPPNNKRLMLFRAASIKYAKALAFASLGDVTEAKQVANHFDSLRGDPDAQHRILHNNSVENLLAVDSVMARGEISYREGNYEEAFQLLRKAVEMQDNLNYDEPWGKMQPIRHALGGLLLEQGELEEAEQVFRRDLVLHPANPWALVGLINTLGKKPNGCCSSSEELKELKEQLRSQREQELAGFNVEVACACCQTQSNKNNK